MKKSKPLIQLISELSEKYKVTSSQITLNWLIHFHGNTVVAIPGATKEAHTRENVGAMGFRLSQEHLQLLDKESEVFK